MNILRIDAAFTRWRDLLDLILASFAYMDSRIDPPSSALQLTPETLKEKAAKEMAYAVTEGDMLLGCIFLRPEVDCLYVGKLAVTPTSQGKGIGRKLLGIAEEVAAGKKLPALRLETRIELTENHATFGRWGFAKTAENAHPGFGRPTSIEMRKALT